MSDSKMTVTVEVFDRAASLEILDGEFQVVARGFGRLEAELAPGLYKARASVGAAVQERIFAVEEGAPPMPVTLDPVRFASPVPLNDTSTSHEYHQAAVAAALNEPPLVLGSGAGLLLSLRDPSDAPSTQTPASLFEYARSFEGFRLYDRAGSLLIDYDQAARRDPTYRYAVLNAELEPGSYVLYWAREGQPVVARPVFIAPGWVTQLFVLIETVGEGALPRPNLADSSVQMAPLGCPDYPSERFFRLAEIARQSLLQGRNIVEHEVMNMLLGDKFGNPLLGLLAAHLLLLDAEPRLSLLHIVLGNLNAMLGPDLPDIVALRLRMQQLEHPDQAPPSDQKVFSPPLLRASWDILAQQAALDEEFFPEESLCRQISDRVVDNGVWLAWRPQPALSTTSGLFTLLSDEELQGKKWRDRERILAVLDQSGDAEGEHDLLQAARHLAKPVLREKLRQFMKIAAHPQVSPSEQVGELVMNLAKTLPWEKIVAKLNDLDEQGAITERLSSVQKTLIPAILMLRKQLQEGQEVDQAQWSRLIANIQLPKSVLVDNLRDLARLAGGLAARFIYEGPEGEYRRGKNT